jgi:hypothetical protein
MGTASLIVFTSLPKDPRETSLKSGCRHSLQCTSNASLKPYSRPFIAVYKHRVTEAMQPSLHCSVHSTAALLPTPNPQYQRPPRNVTEVGLPAIIAVYKHRVTEAMHPSHHCSVHAPLLSPQPPTPNPQYQRPRETSLKSGCRQRTPKAKQTRGVISCLFLSSSQTGNILRIMFRLSEAFRSRFV